MYPFVFIVLCLYLGTSFAAEPVVSCRYRSNHLRQDGGLCFEIPPWQHQPVVLEDHLVSLRERLGNSSDSRRQLRSQLALANSEISRYMDTVLAPFLDTYHRNIQNSYQQLTGKILRRIKDEINAAVQRKQQIFSELTQLADDLKVPSMCEEERRAARTLANRHVSTIYACTEDARASIAKMGKYAEEMIGITRNHMQATLLEATRAFEIPGGNREAAAAQRSGSLQKSDVSSCLEELSRAAVVLGYELDLSLTNARRHNEQSCERLTSCTSRGRRHTEEAVAALRDQIYQCVYA
ncbi:unnamed protein product [Spodoptera littoralis]|uniref:Secreted protein n=1 Tax=Spodoptera littoralis TaxID=7109 RepID=A0A9P0HZS4_SPOLI|nr:unnamed protein product [Spodoptera littoralis]CAH1637555.1 unnamed protein product [Spodoptera littoralis]